MCRIASTFVGSLLCAGVAYAHGNMAPTAVDTKDLPQLGEELKKTNPFRNVDPELKKRVIRVGSVAYNFNCARCHGLEGISGGLAPDLRKIEADDFGDEWFVDKLQNGKAQNGVYKMPPFKGILSQEASWAIRTYIETRPDLEQLNQVTPAAVVLRERLKKGKKTSSELSAIALQLKALASSVQTVSGAPQADTPMARAAEFLKSKPAKLEKAVLALSEGLSR